jgi:two-component system cell cycle sensor histidine kinase/response regulator CckA
VEDHPLVRRVADWLLTRLGYETVLAMDGTQALELLDDEVDLLLTDIVMPGAMSGVELASEARKLRPKLPVLFTSGYSPEQFGINEAALLKKPFTAETLSRAVQQQLDTSPELCRDKS